MKSESFKLNALYIPKSFKISFKFSVNVNSNLGSCIRTLAYSNLFIILLYSSLEIDKELINLLISVPSCGNIMIADI